MLRSVVDDDESEGSFMMAMVMAMVLHIGDAGQLDDGDG